MSSTTIEGFYYVPLTEEQKKDLGRRYPERVCEMLKMCLAEIGVDPACVRPTSDHIAIWGNCAWKEGERAWGLVGHYFAREAS